MKQFIRECKEFGIRIALNNRLITFTMKMVGAKGYKITYKKRRK